MNNTFQIPESLLVKIFDATGTSSSGNKGFILAHINSNGEPVVVKKVETLCAELAMKIALEDFLNKEL
jgi:hypothetical protein